MNAITPGATREPQAILRPSLNLALWIVAAAILSGWVALAALHINDDYRVTHTQGVWLAVAEAARAGHLYPPIFDGEHYAGTRYMPLPILLNALASGVVGDPLIAASSWRPSSWPPCWRSSFSCCAVSPVPGRWHGAGGRGGGNGDRPAGRHDHRRRPPPGGAAGWRPGRVLARSTAGRRC